VQSKICRPYRRGEELMTIEEHIAVIEAERVNWVEKRKRFIRNSPHYASCTRRIHHLDERLGYFRSLIKRHKEAAHRTEMAKLLGGE
jgi:hypothetical protein